MGYMVISDRRLTAQEVFERLGNNDKHLTLAQMHQGNGVENGSAFYMQCMRSNPYEYLILTVAELHQALRATADFNAPLSEVCRMLMSRDGIDEDESDDSQDEGMRESDVESEYEGDAMEENDAEVPGNNYVENLEDTDAETPEDNKPEAGGKVVINKVNEMEKKYDVELEVSNEVEIEYNAAESKNEAEKLDETN